MFTSATPPPTTPSDGASFFSTAVRPRPRNGVARRTGAAGLGALMALGTLPVIVGAATTAQAAVTVGSNISVFPDRDMVVAVGYEEGEQLLVEVVRNDVVIGTTQGPAVETPEGIGLEVNHGPLGTPLPGDCWVNFTPNIIGGDVVRITAVDRPVAAVDTMTVQDVAFSGAPVLEADGSVSVSGTATPGTDFAVEFRRDKPDPRFRRGPFVPVFEAGTSNWKATFRPTATSAEGPTAEQQRQIALNEASWLGVADNITETTLAELGEPGGVGPGCNGSADPNSLVGGLAPVNIGSGDVTFSGTARAGVQAVTVTVGALGTLLATFTPDPAAPAIWTLTVPKADLLTLPDGNVAVTPRFDATVGAARTVLKDTRAPLAPSPSVAPGTYGATQAVALNKPAGEGTSKVYWEIGNADIADPDEFSNLYTSQIAVTSNQTLKGRLVDAAGNPGAVGTFAYRIGTPPAAPSALTATESTTASGAANLRWTAASGATGYNVYRNDVKVNATPLTGTSFADTAAGLGAHSYVVRAVEANGIESLDSNRVDLTIAAPDVPTGLRATEGDTRVTLNWTAVAGAANYRIYRDGVVVAPAVAGTSYINANLTNGTLYEYAITALDAGGNESPHTGVVQAVPQVPADTTAPPAPTVNPATGTYATAQSVAMSSSEAGAVIRYTVGTGTTLPADPGPTSAQYTGAISVGSSQVIKAAAFDAAGNRSPITQRTYTISANVAPTVSTRSPASGATGVAVGGNVTATFSEAVQGVSNTTFTLRSSAGTAITAPVTYDATTRVATLNPSADLAAGTTYTATLTGSSTAIRDSANLALATTTWTFTTASATTPPANVAPTVTTRSPASGATGIAVGGNVTATFSEAVQGVTNTTFTLRSAAGAVTAAVNYNTTTRVATLDPGANLAAGTTYTATLTGSSTTIRDSANLPLATTSWTFTTAPATTNAAPTLISRAPLAGATGVSRINNITMRFSEAVQGANNTTVTLRPISSTGTLGAVVNATVTYNSSTFGVGLDPSVTLTANSRYQVTVTGSSTAIRDLAGAAFASTSWTFTTGA